jgi:hypothetical protein
MTDQTNKVLNPDDEGARPPAGAEDAKRPQNQNGKSAEDLPDGGAAEGGENEKEPE